MSTKIYEAYRTKAGVDIWTLTKRIHETALPLLRKMLQTEYDRMEKAYSEDAKFREYVNKDLHFEKDREKVGYFHWHIYFQHQYGAQLTSYTRDPFNLSISIAIRKYGLRWYLIPYWGDSTAFADMRSDPFLAHMPELEDYSYWNNTDKPKDITEKDWNQRRKVWDFLDKNWQTMLVIDLVSFNSFPFLDDIDYSQSLKK